MLFYHFTPLKTTDLRGGFMRREDGSPIWFEGNTRPLPAEGLRLVPSAET